MVSAMADLRIFSYLPNPRIWKATIAARLNGVDLEVRGAKPSELTSWLWDFDARPLSAEEKGAYAPAARAGRVGFKGGSLIKTDAFLSANPLARCPQPSVPTA
jgi:elongation factor 1-gamma